MSDIESAIIDAAEQRDKWAETVRALVVSSEGIGSRRLARMAGVSRRQVMTWLAKSDGSGDAQDDCHAAAEISDERKLEHEKNFRAWFVGDVDSVDGEMDRDYPCACPTCEFSEKDGWGYTTTFGCHRRVTDSGSICDECDGICQ